jgi:hypothetical protein
LECFKTKLPTIWKFMIRFYLPRPASEIILIESSMSGISKNSISKITLMSISGTISWSQTRSTVFRKKSWCLFEEPLNYWNNSWQIILKPEVVEKKTDKTFNSLDCSKESKVQNCGSIQIPAFCVFLKYLIDWWIQIHNILVF